MRMWLVDESLDDFSVILYNFTFCTFLFLKSNSSDDLGYSISGSKVQQMMLGIQILNGWRTDNKVL